MPNAQLTGLRERSLRRSVCGVKLVVTVVLAQAGFLAHADHVSVLERLNECKKINRKRLQNPTLQINHGHAGLHG